MEKLPLHNPPTKRRSRNVEPTKRTIPVERLPLHDPPRERTTPVKKLQPVKSPNPQMNIGGRRKCQARRSLHQALPDPG